MAFKQLIHQLKTNDLVSSAIILLSLVLVLHVTQVFSRVDNIIYDLGQRLTHGAVPQDVIIIAIDEESLSQLGRWPWSRQLHADLLNQLKVEKPAAIGFDVVFSEPDQTNPAADTALAKAIQLAGNVVLPVILEPLRMNGQMIETLPMPAFIEGAADLGRVHAALDQDSIARSVYLHEGVGTPAWQLFSQAVVNVAQHQSTKNRFNHSDTGQIQNPYALVRQEQRRVKFFGPSGHFYRISYAQVLKGEFTKDLFTNKIVLVGATALGLGDFLTTPVSGLAQPMAGVEFHANVLESIRNGQLIKETPFWVSTFFAMLLACLPLLWLPKLRALNGLLATMLLVALVTLFAGMLPHLGLWMPPAAALAVILLAYPIWSWRKLEAAQRYLDEELHYLTQNLIGTHHHVALQEAHYDEFDARIEQVRAASEQLRYFQDNRKETLAFISHDLRAPLASALMTLEQSESQHQALTKKLHQPLSQALDLAQDFLQASRAEMLDSTSFNELDFAGLVHQSVDDAYDDAIKNNMTLVREIFDGVVWVQGNFGLLQRATLNLILNAVKYGTAHTQVTVALTVDKTSHQVLFSVTDHGLGIPKEQQAHLFKRFSRIKGAEKVAEGSGLGLYFVKTVTEKHQGSIVVNSDLGQATTFSMRLPMISAQQLDS